MAQTFQKILVLRNGDELYLRSMRILLRDIIRSNTNNRQEFFDSREFTSELINDQFIRDLFMSTVGGQQQQQPLFMFSGETQQQQQPLCDFVGQTSARERYTHAICDLITVCVLVSITPPIKEAYQRMGRSADMLPDSAKECLIRYYSLMSQIQSDSVAWLQKIVARNYEINSTELIKCLFKVI